MSVILSELRGITDAVLIRFREQGIINSDTLLEKARTPQGRTELAIASGVDSNTIMKLTNRADMSRIKGIGRIYSDLLEEAGVDTVNELANRLPANLHAKLVEINAKRRLTHRPPSIEQISDFVAQAKLLPVGIEY